MKNRNKTLIISSAIFIGLALLALILGYVLSGYDVLSWFSSKWAMIIYIFVGAYAFAVLMLVIVPKIMDRL